MATKQSPPSSNSSISNASLAREDRFHLYKACSPRGRELEQTLDPLKKKRTGRSVNSRVSPLLNFRARCFQSCRQEKICNKNLGQFKVHLFKAHCGKIANSRFLFALLFVLSLPFTVFAQPTASDSAVPLNGTVKPEGNGSGTTSGKSAVEVDPEVALIPDYFLASVSIDAVVVGERVNMEASVEVVINRDIGWQRIPLRFDQAHIWSREYSGPGEEAPDLSSEANGNGISWMLKGKGKHLLKFSMWAPYQRSIIGSRLQFTLPLLSDQFDTKFQLTIPEANANLRASPHLDIQKIIRDEKSTTFETSVSKNPSASIYRLDAIWTVPQGNAKLVSKVVTKFHLKPANDSLLLIADQTIDLQQDTKELVVKLPTGFERTTLGASQSSIEEIVDRPGWVKVKLVESTAGQVELHWEFRKQLSPSGERITIDGLKIEGAAQEGGSIRIDGLKGYRIIPQLPDSRLVYRVGLGEMPSSKTDSSISSYEYLQQPFQLVQEIRPIEPRHSVSVIHELDISSNKMTLNVHQLIEVERGSVSNFHLQWPQYKSENWKFLKAETASLTTGEVITTVDDEKNTISFQLSKPVLSGERIHLISQFESPISLTEKSEIHWTFPHVPQENARTELLLISLEDQLALTLDEASESQLSPPLSANYLDQLSQMWGLSVALERLLKSPETRFLNSDGSAVFDATITQHQRELSVHSTVEIQEATPRDLLIHQRFDLGIKYGRIQSVELKIPDALLERMGVAGISAGLSVVFEGEPLTPNMIGNVPRIIFPRKIIGKNSFEIQYRFPLNSSAEEQRVSLPVISLGLLPFDQVACLITPVENVQLVTENTGWIPAQTSPRGPLWVKDLNHQAITSIPLRVGGRLADSSQQYVVEHAHLWTYFEDDGRAKTLARYEIISPPARLIMTFPPNSKFITIVDGEPLAENAITRSNAQSEQVIINLPDGINDTRIIEFQYLTESSSPFSFAESQTFQFPQFAKTVWVNETIWEVQLPFGFHLFEYPDLKPLFSWMRRGLIWERVPNIKYLLERQKASAALPDSFQFDENYYAFRGFSPVDSVRFRSMNRSLILLIGAGFALLLGFVFYRFSVTRNVFSLVVLAFVFAVASVWYLEPLLLLLQPAIIGVVLALTATIIDLRIKRLSPDHSTIQRRRVAGSDSHSGSQQDLGEGTTRIFTPISSSGSDLSRE